MSDYVNGPLPPESLVGALHDRPDVSEEYAPGKWRPAVPLPFYGFLHVRCWECGRRFWGTPSAGLRPERYQRHYLREHIGGGPDER